MWAAARGATASTNADAVLLVTYSIGYAA